MRGLLACVALALTVAGAAAADTIDVLRGNTLILREQSGKVYTVLIGGGSRLEQVNSAGAWADGSWRLEDGKFCWTARGGAMLCIPMPGDKQVGDSWEIRGPVGQLVWTAEIQVGRADLQALAAEAAAPAEP